jgi:alkaline phosphatase D
MAIYDAIRRLAPDFFVHSGDMIYADNPLQTEARLPGGGVWKNLMTPEKAKVAETLDEFRGNHTYNLMDEHVRRFAAEIAQYAQWDDHEVTNKWFHERILDDSRYTVKSCALLAARARRAMFEFTPIAVDAHDQERVHRAIHRGPLLDVFLLDRRSYRGPNSENRQAALADESRILGAAQVQWLKRALLASRATWKVIAADMALGLVVRHDARQKWGSEAVAQGDGPPLGRELEIADLLRFIKQNDVANVVDHGRRPLLRRASLRARPRPVHGVHAVPRLRLGAAPRRGVGPNELDNTFGPQVVFTRHPAGRANTPPTEGGLYFGHVRIDGATRVMTVSHRDVTGAVLDATQLMPAA